MVLIGITYFGGSESSGRWSWGLKPSLVKAAYTGLYHPLIMEKQMAKNMENKMEAGGISGFKELN